MKCVENLFNDFIHLDTRTSIIHTCQYSCRKQSAQICSTQTTRTYAEHCPTHGTKLLMNFNALQTVSNSTSFSQSHEKASIRSSTAWCIINLTWSDSEDKGKKFVDCATTNIPTERLIKPQYFQNVLASSRILVWKTS
jgi:hypothetical protein